MTRHLLLVTFFCALLCPTASAQEQACRTKCGAREVIDAYGCCAPLEMPSASLNTPSHILPDAISIEDQHARPPFAMRAYHMLAPPFAESDRATLIDQIIDTTKTLKSPSDPPRDAMQTLLEWDAMSVAAWQVWMTFESELHMLYETCSETKESDVRAGCLRDLSAKLEARTTWLELARPIWQRVQARPKDQSLDGEPLVAAIRAQAMFYQAAAELAAGQADQGFTLVKSLLTFDQESPWAALASMSLADFFLETRSPELAAPFYLKAARHPHSPAAAYAYYRHALCLVETGQWSQGMRMLIRALEEIQAQGDRLPGVSLLNKAVTRDLIALYAQTGAARDAPKFFDALAVPLTIMPLYLERLRDAYLQVGREDEAKVLTDLLDGLQESSPGEGTSMPRSR